MKTITTPEQNDGLFKAVWPNFRPASRMWPAEEIFKARRFLVLM